MKLNTVNRDRSIGSFIGAAVGDAVGATNEFKSAGTFTPITDMVGGGAHRLVPGQWTDDTSMALGLADSILNGTGHKGAMENYLAWANGEKFSSDDQRGCFDIGITVSTALAKYRVMRNEFAGSTDPNSAGNGSLMRLAPVPVAYQNQPVEALMAACGESSKTTHGAKEAVDACAVWGAMIFAAFKGAKKEDISMAGALVCGPNTSQKIVELVNAIKFDFKNRPTGYVVDSFACALRCFANTTNFRDCILMAANLGGDADTIACIAGQLAGAYYGLSGIPAEWVAKLAKREELFDVAERLCKFAEAD